MPNNFEVYKGNDKTINCTVTGLSDLDGFAATLSVKKYAAAADPVLFSSTGTIVGLVITFQLTSTQTTLSAGKYVYEVVLESETKKYTITQDILTILESVKY